MINKLFNYITLNYKSFIIEGFTNSIRNLIFTKSLHTKQKLVKFHYRISIIIIGVT